MFCKKCGKELQEEVAFCPGCGEQQGEQQLNNAQPQPVYHVPKPLKKPTTSVILNLIAVFLFVFAEAVALIIRNGGSQFKESYLLYFFIFPLLLSLAVLFFKNIILKIICSSFGLAISILMIFFCFSSFDLYYNLNKTCGGWLWYLPLAGAILQIIASSRNLSYSRRIIQNKQLLPDNEKLNKNLKIISIAAIATIILIMPISIINQSSAFEKELENRRESIFTDAELLEKPYASTANITEARERREGVFILSCISF